MKSKLLTALFFCTFFCILGVQNAFSQRIEFDLTIHTEKLSIPEREHWEGVDKMVKDLVNSINWVDRHKSMEFPIFAEVILEKSIKNASYRKGGAGIMMATTSGIQLRDRRWEFAYSKDLPLRIGEHYDTFTGLIEFYILICIGFEMDRISPLAGQPYYEKARMVAENARFEMDYYLGWEQRRDFAWKILGEELKPLRTAAYHLNASSYFINKGDLVSAEAHLSRVIDYVISTEDKSMTFKPDDHIIIYVNKTIFIHCLDEVQNEELELLLLNWDPEFFELDIEE